MNIIWGKKIYKTNPKHYFGRLARRPNTKIKPCGAPTELFFNTMLYIQSLSSSLATAPSGVLEGAPQSASLPTLFILYVWVPSSLGAF